MLSHSVEYTGKEIKKNKRTKSRKPHAKLYLVKVRTTVSTIFSIHKNYVYRFGSLKFLVHVTDRVESQWEMI